LSYAIFLAGPSGSGKSTLHADHLSSFARVSSDAYIEAWCKRDGIAYSQGFEKYIGPAQEAFETGITLCQQNDRSYVVDRTNLNEDSRKKVLRLVNPRYKKICIYFPSYNVKVLSERVIARATAGGHSVSDQVIFDILDRYNIPKYNE
jgi:predicted ABC-type ATPase